MEVVPHPDVSKQVPEALLPVSDSTWSQTEVHLGVYRTVTGLGRCYPNP